MECTLCKTGYVGKTETSFNIRSNNRRSDVTDTNAIPASRHFAQNEHNFNTHAKFTLIETIINRSKPVQIFQECLQKWENFWFKTLDPLQPHRLDHELNQ